MGVVKTISVKKGLTVSLPGAPRQVISNGPDIMSVEWRAPDSCAIRPDNKVIEGHSFRCGEPLFVNRLAPLIVHTAPASGCITRVSYTEQGSLQSIELQCNSDPAITFRTPDRPFSTDAIRCLLQQSGLWTQLRERPFDVTPSADTTPSAVFVTAMDTRPLAPDPAVIIADRSSEFSIGIEALVTLTAGKVFVCQASLSAIAQLFMDGVEQTVFTGKHPAGLVGTHMQYLHPVSQDHPAWHIDYQDVIAIGSLLLKGVLSKERVISIAGEPLKEPRLVRTKKGARIADILKSEQLDTQDAIQTISGSVFAGRRHRFLGQFDSQLVLYSSSQLNDELATDRSFLADNLATSSERNSDVEPSPAFLQAPLTKRLPEPIKAFAAEPRFERVSPLRVLPVPLLRALLVEDFASAQALGCLGLGEEDLEPFAYVCPAGNDYPAALRSCLQALQAMSI